MRLFAAVVTCVLMYAFPLHAFKEPPFGIPLNCLSEGTSCNASDICCPGLTCDRDLRTCFVRDGPEKLDKHGANKTEPEPKQDYTVAIVLSVFAVVLIVVGIFVTRYRKSRSTTEIMPLRLEPLPSQHNRRHAGGGRSQWSAPKEGQSSITSV